MKMRYLLSFALTLTMAVAAMSLSACGSSVESKSAAASLAAATTFKNSALLVSGATLAATIDSPGQVYIDVRSAADYALGHVKNAVNLPPSTFDIGAGGNGINNTDLKSVDEIKTILGNAGVSSDAKIVVYGKTNADYSAGRVFWLLEYLGASKVQVLDGGYEKWVSDGRATVTAATALPAAVFTPAVVGSRSASKADVLARYADTATYAVVDSRNASDYAAKNIPNSINVLIGEFLNADNTLKPYSEIKAMLDAKGITAGKTVVTNCYVGYRSGQEYFLFRLMGFNVSNYDGSWTEWNADTTLPTATAYKNSALLVSGATLAATIANPGQVYIDVRSAADYALGHIGNAVNLPPATFDIGAGGNGINNTDLKSVDEIKTILGNAGVSSDAKIVVYGKTNADYSAGRVFWLLEYLGASKVQVLDGGYEKWVSDGRATVTAVTALPAAVFTPAVVGSRSASKADVLARYADTATYAVVDSRNAPDYAAKHIPNSINVLIGEFLNADNTLKPYSEIKAMLDGKGITAGKTVITNCYVGYRSGQEYFLFRLMGFNVSNYDGSWTEWNADAALPTAP